VLELLPSMDKNWGLSHSSENKRRKVISNLVSIFVN
jgi:hypothetical protein